MKEALSDRQSATDLRRKQLRTELARLEVQEENLLDLAAESPTARQKVRQRLNDIEIKRAKLNEEVNQAVADLTAGAELLEAVLKVMGDSGRIYPLLATQDKRLFIQALFTKLYVDENGITDEQIREPIAEIVEASRLATPILREQHRRRGKANESKQPACSRSTNSTLANLLAMSLAGHGSSKDAMVELRGIEPLTSSMPWKRSTN
jgi:site-specific DNA recombinase